ncbi:phage tail tape measure protein [Parvibium lacunae]|uniref:Phage tail tape measure protein n=1 Tax=Parvibium lacunae TaxID=1888893 RepID=A0A368L7W5_9BURK|nr:phage tail tape measure protein [Parvibium lacunae]RCS59716.1 phage tail tape measure protein [Parvibium lacunae]
MSDAVINIGADSTKLRQDLERAAREFADKTNAMRERAERAGASFSKFTEKVKEVTPQILSLSGVIGGVSFSGIIMETAKVAGQLSDLSQKVGIGAGNLSQLAYAAQANGIGFEQLETGLKKFSLNISEAATKSSAMTQESRDAASALKAMGISTTDAEGKLKNTEDLLIEVADKFSGYNDGANKAALATALFGRAGADLLPFLNQGKQGIADLRKEGIELGATMSDSMVKAADEYGDNVDKLRSAFKGLVTTIGNSVMPALTKVTTELIEGRKAFGGWWSALVGIGLSTTTSLPQARADIEKINKEIAKLESQRATEEARGGIGSKNMLAAYDKALAEKYEELQTANNRLRYYQALADRQNAQGAKDAEDAFDFGKRPKKKGRNAPEFGSGGGSAGEKSADNKSSMSKWDAELTVLKQQFELQNQLKSYDLNDEFAYWESKKGQVKAGSDDVLAILSKQNAVRIQQLKQSIDAQQKSDKEEAALSAASIDGMYSRWEKQIELEQEATEERLIRGEISQAEYLQLLRRFEEQKFAVQRDAQLARIELAKLDPSKDPAELERLNQQLAQVHYAHSMRIAGIQQRETKQGMQFYETLVSSMTSLWDKGLQAMMNGTLTWKGAMRAIYAELTRVFIQQVIMEQLKRWLMMQSTKLMAMMGFETKKRLLEGEGATKAIEATATEATAKISGQGASAAAGAAASQAPIPIVGPGLAVAAAAAMLALVLGYRAMVKSASGGFDIGFGDNPLTQLHQEEMVLPRVYGNTLRDMAEVYTNSKTGADTQAASNAAPIVLGGVSAGDFFIAHKRELAQALKAATRNGVR